MICAQSQGCRSSRRTRISAQHMCLSAYILIRGVGNEHSWLVLFLWKFYSFRSYIYDIQDNLISSVVNRSNSKLLSSSIKNGVKFTAIGSPYMIHHGRITSNLNARQWKMLIAAQWKMLIAAARLFPVPNFIARFYRMPCPLSIFDFHNWNKIHQCKVYCTISKSDMPSVTPQC